MALLDTLVKVLKNLPHWPTWFFIIGYPLYWIELYILKAPQGVVSPLAWILFVCVIAAGIFYTIPDSLKFCRECQGKWHQLAWFGKMMTIVAFLGGLCCLLIAAVAASKAIHLPQELDCLNYHYTLPRQHLILGSFAHIPWAADDLFLLPIDFALAPFWFVSIFLNKWPQFFIFLGLLLLLARTAGFFDAHRRNIGMGLVVLACLASHGIGIQLGTGMLDISIAYLFFAMLDSLRQKQWAMAAVEAAFFCWSKPVMPLVVAAVIVILLLVSWVGRRNHMQVWDAMTLNIAKNFYYYFVLVSIFIAGPFIIKSIYYAGTPLFPAGVGVLPGAAIKANPTAWSSLTQASQIWMNTIKDGYGHGRDLIAFMKHWWLMAVPESGVNNAYDYPMGLPYLLALGPFFYFVVQDLRKKIIPVYAVVVMAAWVIWWFGSQQSRFLYIPVLLMFCVVFPRLTRISKVLLFSLVAALSLNVLSMWRAHRQDIALSSQDIVKSQVSRLAQSPDHLAAYAQFPLTVYQEKLPHTIAF